MESCLAISADPEPERRAQPAAALVRGLEGGGWGDSDLAAGGSKALDFLAQALADLFAVGKAVCTTVGGGTGDTDSSVSCWAASQSAASKSAMPSTSKLPRWPAHSEVSSMLLTELLVLRLVRMVEPE